MSAAEAAEDAVEAGRAQARMDAAQARFAQGEALAALGREAAAQEAYRRARDHLDARGDTAVAQDYRARVAWRLGEGERARALRATLAEQGYARPDHAAFWAKADASATVEVTQEETGDGG